MRKPIERDAARKALEGAGAPWALVLELCATIDDGAALVASELSDQWDQLKGIAEAARYIEGRLEKIDDRLFELVGEVKKISR